jgi:hypothetical protein
MCDSLNTQQHSKYSKYTVMSGLPWRAGVIVKPLHMQGNSTISQPVKVGQQTRFTFNNNEPLKL